MMKWTIFFFCILASNLLISQDLTIDTDYTPAELVTDFFNSDSIIVSNVVYTGSPSAIGFFDSEVENLDIHAGIVLSSGQVVDLPGDYNIFISEALNAEGDPDIEILSGGVSTDASILEFDFTVTQDLFLDFSYVFGSEEYPEFVGSPFNDAFGFFISGPNYSGPYSNMAENIAMIPDSDIDVAINSINENTNSEYYVTNTTSNGITLDAYTTLLPASFTALAGQTYHIKIVVSDVADSAYDSAVLLGFNSLGNPDSLVPPAEVSLLKNGPNLIVENNSKYATSYSWDFGNGVTSLEKDPGTVIYESLGNYEVTLITNNYCCSDTSTTTVNISSLEPVSGEVTVENHVSCFGSNDGELSSSITGGTGNYNIDFFPEIDDMNMVPSGYYTYTVLDDTGNMITGELTVTEPLALTAETTTTDDDGTGTGTASVTMSGGTMPYDYLWSNNETDNEISNLEGGIYYVTITDENDCSLVETIEVTTVVGIQEVTFETFDISPNPASSIIVIDKLSNSYDNAKLHDIYGKEFNLQFSVINGQMSADISQLPDGFYILILVDTESDIKSIGKFVKSK